MVWHNSSLDKDNVDSLFYNSSFDKNNIDSLFYNGGLDEDDINSLFYDGSLDEDNVNSLFYNSSSWFIKDELLAKLFNHLYSIKSFFHCNSLFKNTNNY